MGGGEQPSLQQVGRASGTQLLRREEGFAQQYLEGSERRLARRDRATNREDKGMHRHRWQRTQRLDEGSSRDGGARVGRRDEHLDNLGHGALRRAWGALGRGAQDDGREQSAHLRLCARVQRLWCEDATYKVEREGVRLALVSRPILHGKQASEHLRQRLEQKVGCTTREPERTCGGREDLAVGGHRCRCRERDAA